MKRLLPMLGALLLATSATMTASGQTGATATDPYLWLESLNGPRALAWVKAENAKTLTVLQKDSHFAGFFTEALKIGEAKDRIPYPSIIKGRLYNFWQDEKHVRGIWRSTTVADYAKPQPTWTTVLDLDALATVEKKNWIWQGADCDSPSRQRCLISLSEGGEDAATVREFDLASNRFVPNGFVLSRGKQSTAWLSEDTLLVSREWAKGDVTASGYSFITKTIVRGQPLSRAVELHRGTKADVSAGPYSITDGAGHRVLGISRGVSFFESENFLLTPKGLKQLAIPKKARIQGLIQNRLLVRIAEPWTVNGATFTAGTVLSLDLTATMNDPTHLKPTVIFAPGPRETFDGLMTTRDRLIVASYEEVRGRAAIYAPQANGGWTRQALRLPDNATIAGISADDQGNDAYLIVTSFLAPTTLIRVDANAGTTTQVKAIAAQFDGAALVTEQLQATSKDGTKVPYFVVHAKNMKLDGSTPTLMTAYGGFEVPMTPFYDGSTGKLWLERGGAFVLANIRGGGEFGPAWHEAGLKTHRQLIYDDFAAVAQDLFTRKITSARRLGIEGGSNGGLLMGVEFTQHPELWSAVSIQVPLLDMLRYEQIQAGASWVGEYGSVSIPAERTFLASISPYHNVKAGVKYPQPLIWTTTKDDRVGPQHARKFAAKLGAMGIPYYFYEVTEGGHGAGANAKERAFTEALEFTYFTRKLMN